MNKEDRVLLKISTEDIITRTTGSQVSVLDLGDEIAFNIDGTPFSVSFFTDDLRYYIYEYEGTYPFEIEIQHESSRHLQDILPALTSRLQGYETHGDPEKTSP